MNGFVLSTDTTQSDASVLEQCTGQEPDPFLDVQELYEGKQLAQRRNESPWYAC